MVSLLNASLKSITYAGYGIDSIVLYLFFFENSVTSNQ